MKKLLCTLLVGFATSCGDDLSDKCIAQRDHMIEQSLDKRGLTGPDRDAHREALLAAAGQIVVDACMGGRR
jgi:hypothetical protein